MPEENGNGKNGKDVGLLDKVKTGIKDDLNSLKTDMPAKAKEQDSGLYLDLPPQARRHPA
jgi:hypothetical protein